MRVIGIVKAHFVAGGFDGLVQTDAECGCLCDDLAPCCADPAVETACCPCGYPAPCARKVPLTFCSRLPETPNARLNGTK